MKREMIQVTETVRVENGPQRVTSVATEELLDDEVTARHYRAEERDAEGNLIRPATKDAMGKTIVIGESMTYLDYRQRRKPFGWYVYQEREVGIDETGRMTDIPDDIDHLETRYVPVSCEATKDAALDIARGL